MREIKFRAWGKYTKSMMEWNYLTQTYDLAEFFSPDPDLIPMQFTGLHDKNGVEIYQSDILWKNGMAKYEVVWSTESAQFLLSRLVNDRLDDKEIQIAKYMEIVGNSCENPELLTQ